ncbi:unnamed protein product, partial [Prorocentrum cordatum]
MRAPTQSKAAAPAEKALAKRLSTVIGLAKKNDVADEVFLVLREIPGVGANLPTGTASLARRLARETAAWQERAGCQRMPGESTGATEEERRLAYRLRNIMPAYHAGDLPDEDRQTLERLPGFAASLESAAARLARDTAAWQARVGCQRMPGESTGATEEERRLAYRFRNIMPAYHAGDLPDDDRQAFERLPGFAASQDSAAARLARDTAAWQRRAGCQRMPGESAGATEEECRLARYWRNIMPAYVAGDLSPEDEAVFAELPGFNAFAAWRQASPGERLRQREERQRDKRAAKSRAEQAASQQRRALLSAIPGRNQRRLPESERMLHGASSTAAARRDAVFQRAAEVDDYLQSLRFSACDYCERGWWGTTRRPPAGSSTTDIQDKYMNFILADEEEWLDPRRPMSVQCSQDVQAAARRAADIGDSPPTTPRLLTSFNDMTFGRTHEALDALTYFEEQLLSPIQPVVRIFTLYGTGLTEARGHVANWVQNGPELVRAIPLKAGDAKILLVRRFPKDPQRKQRAPFVVSRQRLEAALQQLLKPEDQGGHRAFQRNRLVRNGLAPVNWDNLSAYDDTGREPEGMEVKVVEQHGPLYLDKALLGKWTALNLELQLNGQVRHFLDGIPPPDPRSDADAEHSWEERAWPWLCKFARDAMLQRQPPARDGQDMTPDRSPDGARPPPPAVDQEPPPSADAKVLSDTALACWLRTWARWSGWEDNADVLHVLRDELTAVQEVDALRHNAAEHSGTWDPENPGAKRSEEELLDEFWEELVEEHGGLAEQTPPLQAAAGTAAAAPPRPTAPVRLAPDRQQAPPQPAAGRTEPRPPERQADETFDTANMDTPWYISAAFVKIFQTGEGRDGRALRHPRFFYFAVNTLLRNKAYQEYAPQQLLHMGKAGMTRVLCAYETNLPGSAAEKLSQRPDLESMLNQLEEESAQQAAEQMPSRSASLTTLTNTVDRWHRDYLSASGNQSDEAVEQALRQARRELAQWPAAPQAPAPPGMPLAGEAGAAATVQRSAADLLAERAPLLHSFQEAIEQHARYRRDAEQGGCIPAHFITLTTAIYHWSDLAHVLDEFETQTTSYRHGRCDPLEPGEGALTDGKRRVLQHPGVVAWFCALKLHLYASYVLAYDDLFGVFEWGSGGILHMHMLGWRFPGFGRYDYLQGDVPQTQRREDARAMAWQHGAELSEWNPSRLDHWDTAGGFDEDLTPENPATEYGPVPVTDASDSDHDGCGAGAAAEEPPTAAETAGMARLRALLQDPTWHPSSLPMDLKRMLLTSRSVLVRRMRRWYYAALLTKTHMHDRHSGEPVTLQPVFGDDPATDSSDSGRDGPDLKGGGDVCTEVRVLSWNTNLATECSFVVSAADESDVLRLQEATSASAAWLQAQLQDTFDVITPTTCGGAWDAEGHGVVIAVRTSMFEVCATRLRNLPSDQQRVLLTVRLRARDTHLVMLVATAHLESGADLSDARRAQLGEVVDLLRDPGADAAVFAADCNLRRDENIAALQVRGLGED